MLATDHQGVLHSKKTSRGRSTFFVWIGLIIGISILVGIFATPYMGAASLAYLLMSFGFLQRKTPELHGRLMSYAMLLDVFIVLTLEFQREAIKTALDFSLNPWQQAHIGLSTLAILLYLPVFYLGRKRLKGQLAHLRKLHIRLGITAYLLRSLGFILMFSLLWPHQT